jgi:hypothetical protein
MNKNYRRTLFLGLALLFVSQVGACPLHITNDTNHTVFFVEKDGDYAHILHPGEKTVFGNTIKHLYFYLFKEGKNGAFEKECTVHQHTCTMNKKVETTVSVIENHQLDNAYFDYEDAQ